MDIFNFSTVTYPDPKLIVSLSGKCEVGTNEWIERVGIKEGIGCNLH